MILQCNPKAGYVAHQAEIDAAIKRTLNSGWYILGHEVEAFEKEFAAYVDIPHCVSCANGTDALELALRSLNIGTGDKVLTVPNTAVATVAAIERAGAVPGFVDIDPVTYTMSPEALEQQLNMNDHSIKAVIAVHLFGHPAAMKQLAEITEKYRVCLIEDCAQAHGAALDGIKVGNFGEIATFSFYPTKNLGALGDGGAVVTSSLKLVRRMQAIRQYGWEERYISSCQGINSRLDELQAAILRVKLQYLDQNNAQRQAIAKIYTTELGKIPEITLPQTGDGYNHVYHQYVIQIKGRDQLKTFLQDNGIGTAVHYPVLIHQQPAYSDHASLKLATAEQLNERILSLPMFPELDNSSIETVIDAIKQFYQGRVK
ncbi:MAG: DegT/DnrJ/EryC1/StrS family aminotransferase [Victivallaceae bacterium]|nr:DegT/DnrJ/EryC1/StrS family aminotransferase [Victivallaceae bacterium]